MKVKSIKPGRARVYDLTVEGDHNFIANGQCVHNCLRDVSRVLQVPLAEVNAVTNSIIERSSGDERASQTIEDSFRDFEVCRDFNKRHPEVLHHARRLEGLAKNLGIHAAGVVTSPVPLTDLLPLEIRKHDGQDIIVTALDMYGAAAVGLVKLDVLGLRTLTVIKEALEAIHDEHGVEVDMESEDFNLNDPQVLAAFTAHDYGGIFQYDTPSADKVCSGVTFSNFEDIAAMTALNRPGTARSGLATKYVERKKNPKLVEKVDFHPKVSAITADTLGIIVYQEHVIKIFTECAGFAPGTADSLRKTIAKKVGDETIGKERENFVKGCKRTSGIDEATANKIMDAITFFGCLEGDSLVLTPQGPRRIDAIKFGDFVLSFNAESSAKSSSTLDRRDGSEIQEAQQQICSNRNDARGQGARGSESGVRMDSVAPMVDGAPNRTALGRRRVRSPQERRQVRQQVGELGVVESATESKTFGLEGEAKRIHHGEDGEGVGVGASCCDGKASQARTPAHGNRPSQGRQPGEQHVGESGVGGVGRTHPSPSCFAQGRASASRGVCPQGLQGFGLLSRGLQKTLFPVVQESQEAQEGPRGQAELVRNKIKRVVSTGLKQVFEMRLSGGIVVRPSADHWWLTDTGWARTRDIVPGCVLICVKAGGVREVCVVQSIQEVGEVETWDLECEFRGEYGELANYLVGDGKHGWLVSHNSYGFNKTLCENAWVWKAGANGKDPRHQVQIKELVSRWDERNESGALTPMAQKLRCGNFNLIQMDEDGRCRPARLIGIHDHGERDCYVIKTLSGHETPAISRTHRMMTSEGYKSIASGLGVGHRLLFMGKNSDRDYSSWWMDADRRFAQEGRVTDAYRAVVEGVWSRARSVCEECGGSCSKGRGGAEVAHIRTPPECDYSKAAFHSPANLKLLCNSCHKTLDCEKGERRKRWEKGRSTFADDIVEVVAVGKRHCYDLEMDSSGHNFVAGATAKAPPAVSHNSHATEYGMIAYWCMFLKVYYPLEFFWALLKNEPDRLRIAQLAKDAKKHGIKLLPPHVNTSRKAFAMDRDNGAIRGSLVDIKGVGPAAADTIMENQPFTDWWDFMGRIERRKVHKGVIMALAKAGALSGLVPSTKWFVENLEEFWKEQGKKKGRAKEMLAEAEGADDWDEEDAALISSQVNPLAFGKHPIDAYKDFMKRAVKVKIVDMSSETFFKDHGDKGTFIAGVVLEVKYNQVGDFHTGALPTEDERHKMHWGARYANVNIEDKGGKQNRTKFDIDIFDSHRPLIDSGVGTPVIAHVIPNEKFENCRAQFAVDLGLLRKRMADGEGLTVWERIVIGQHPAAVYPWKDEETRKKRMTNSGFKKSTVGGVFTGVVTNVKTKWDKNDNQMAFFGLLGADGTFIDVIAFSSVWRYARTAIKPGRLIRVTVEKKPDRFRGWSYFCGDRVKVMKKAP